MNPAEMMFRRRFSVNLYKNRRLELSRMNFYKDFVNTNRGDPYPILSSCGEYTETVMGGRYIFSSERDGTLSRLLGQFFPYASYELGVDELDGKVGFTFRLSDGAAVFAGIETVNGYIELFTAVGERCERYDSGWKFFSGLKFIVTCRRDALDFYFDNGKGIVFIKSFALPEFASSSYRKVFSSSTASVTVSGDVMISSVKSYMDSGISQADIRPIRYENGDIMTDGGKVYLTMSVRMQAGGYQGIFSWIPGTDAFELTGALFYDGGDGLWGNDVAASVLYHRSEKKWYVWVCSFCRGHILGHAVARGDIRFGVNVLDITLMERMTEGACDTDFLGKQGDEDPDFRFDEERGVWIMSLCRISSATGAYSYFFFESDRPFDGYRYIGNTKSGAETGGSMVKIGGELYFICGNDFSKRADYRVYRYGDFDNHSKLRCDYDDGGFRGWGTVMPIELGTRRRFFWLTFDRHNGSDYNWSYGNLYGYEADEYEMI